MSRGLVWTIGALAIVGCAGGAPPVAAPAPSGVAPAARFVPPADRYVKSVLLDFESPVDARFVVASGARLVNDPAAPDNRVLLTAGPSTVKLGALLSGRAFPGPWDLIGVRVRPSTNVRCNVVASAGTGATAVANETLAAGRWRTLWLETRALDAPAPTTATTEAAENPLTLSVSAGADDEFLIDEVMLAQGRIVVGDGTSPQTGEAWRVERRGTRWRAKLGEREVLTLPAAPFAEDGYRVVESSAARAVFLGPQGDTVAIDRLGRVIRSDRPPAAPAAIEIVDGQARVDRDLAGDRDNDGFDETRGCYAIRAAGDRFTFRLDGAGSNAPAAWPTVEIRGLRPDGAVSVWVEGQLVTSATRTADGRTIVELPIAVERPVDVQVRVKA